MPQSMNWKEYQEKAADFFRSLGLEASTNVALKGVRTQHDIDVLVKSHHAGFAVMWVVECKYWMSKVSKLHVLALREIVSDTGADRGILLAEHGFQSGALEAATLTNVQITSLADLTVSANRDILSMRLRDAYDRLMQCKQDYWEIPKADRIEHGLRPEVADVGYSGDWAIKTAEDLISKGLRGTYPIFPDEMHATIAPAIIGQDLPKRIETLNDLLATVAPIVQTLEKKISAVKQHQSQNA